MTRYRANNRWHYQPDLTASMAPYYDWPPKFGESARRMIAGWSIFDVRIYVLALSLLMWCLCTPDLSETKEFELGWIAQIWLRWLVTLSVIAGGLHLYFHTFEGQGIEEKYHAKALARKSRRFHFGDQLLDNIFWVLVGTVGFLTAYEALMLWAYSNGYANQLDFVTDPFWGLGLFLLIPGWTAFHFYWQHRAFHIPALYRLGHHWHHKNINVGPWSGAAVHPLENLVWFSAVLILLLLPSHPTHALFLMHLQVITAITTHVGFDRLKIGPRHGLQLGDFFHQLHHQFHDCNYGTMSGPWDRWFGTYHDGHAANSPIGAIQQERLEKSAVGR